MLLLLLKSRQWDVRTGRHCPAKESVFGSLPNFCCPGKSSWLGEIMRQIKLRAKPEYLLLHVFCFQSIFLLSFLFSWHIAFKFSILLVYCFWVFYFQSILLLCHLFSRHIDFEFSIFKACCFWVFYSLCILLLSFLFSRHIAFKFSILKAYCFWDFCFQGILL